MVEFQQVRSAMERQIRFCFVWGRHMNMMFSLMNARRFEIDRPEEEELFLGGAYTRDKRISNEMLALVLRNSIYAIGYEQTICAREPDVYMELMQSLLRMMNSARRLAAESSRLFLNQFPAVSFLRLFGPALTFAKPLGKASDSAVAVCIETLLHVVAFFDPEGSGDVIPQIVAYIGKRVEAVYPLRVGAFLRHANSVLTLRPMFATYILRTAIDQLPRIDWEKSAGGQPHSFETAVLPFRERRGSSGDGVGDHPTA
jgi:hypothetical protein